MIKGLSILFFSGVLFGRPRFAMTDEEKIADGKAIFGAQCSRCHGADAKGNGMDAKRLPVVPRNLTEGVFKFQSTAQGTPPSDDDLMWTLNHGMTGAGMPSFGNLSLESKQNIIA